MMPTIGPDKVGIDCGSAASPSTAGILWLGGGLAIPMNI